MLPGVVRLIFPHHTAPQLIRREEGGEQKGRQGEMGPRKTERASLQEEL